MDIFEIIDHIKRIMITNPQFELFDILDRIGWIGLNRPCFGCLESGFIEPIFLQDGIGRPGGNEGFCYYCEKYYWRTSRKGVEEMCLNFTEDFYNLLKIAIENPLKFELSLKMG